MKISGLRNRPHGSSISRTLTRIGRRRIREYQETETSARAPSQLFQEPELTDFAECSQGPRSAVRDQPFRVAIFLAGVRLGFAP